MSTLCKDCAHRHRRIFITRETEEPEESLEDNIVIMNTCLLLDIDISGEDTIWCNKYDQLKGR